MIELIILDGQNFNVKDYTFSNNYAIIFDSLVQNNSTFNITKRDINASENDLLVTKEFDKQFIGIISSINKTDELTTISCYHFSKKFDLTFIGSSKTDVNLGDYIKSIIDDNLIESDDSLQNISYLTVTNNSTITGAISLNANASANILDVITSILKSYELVINYNLTYTESGGFKGIDIDIEDVSQQLIIDSKEKFIKDITVSDGKVGAVNKLVYYPNSENILYKKILKYYLLKDGTISENANDVNRISPVVNQSEYYQDADIYYDEGATLLAKVKETFANTTYNHYIRFTLNANKAIPINSINLGDRVMFRYDNKEYNSIVTQLYYSSSTGNVQIQLGLNRVTLTDKLAMKG